MKKYWIALLSLFLFCSCTLKHTTKSDLSSMENRIHNSLYALINKTYKDEGMYKGNFNEEKEIMAYGSKALPVLIEHVKDSSPFKWNFMGYYPTVGDYAYFTICSIMNVDIVEYLPLDIKEDYKTKGVIAYYEYINKDRNNRRNLYKVLKNNLAQDIAQ